MQLDSGICVRRITIQLEKQTRHGDWQVTVLTNLPEAEVTALVVSELYLKRWEIEKMFQVIIDTFNCELKTLGYPKAALFSFCMALVAFNILSTVKSALKEIHGAEKIDAELSSYYVVEEVQSTFRGMEVAIESEEWAYFSEMTVTTFADMLRTWAAKVNLKRFLKSLRGKKKPQKKKTYDPKHPHLSTFRLLSAQ